MISLLCREAHGPPTLLAHLHFPFIWSYYLLYAMFQEVLGYLQALTTYCLRRALGNAINGALFWCPAKTLWLFVQSC